MRRLRRLAVFAAVIVAITAAAVVASASPDASRTAQADRLRCPANSKLMQAIADYDESRPIDGFDTPEEALENLRRTAYPKMPPGQFRRAAASGDRVLFESDVASSVIREVDLRRRPAADAPVIVEESGTEWVVQDFTICESDARRWAR